jgi:hypothetical protein
MKNAMLVLDCTQSVAPVTCFSQQGQDVRMNNFFCVNAFLCCIAVVSDGSRKYAVGYSLLCSCCWQLDFCVK